MKKLEYKKFLKNYFTPALFLQFELEKNKPYGMLFILIINAFIGAFLTSLYLGHLFNFSLKSNLSVVLMFATYLLGGIIYSLLRYFVFGGIFHLFVLFAGGKDDYLTSRNIFLFARLPENIFALIVLLYTFFDNLLFLAIPEFPSLILLLGTVFFNFYSFALIYKATKEKQETKALRSIIFFIILPVLYVLLVVLPAPSFLL